MSGGILALVAIATAIYLSKFLFQRHGEKSATVSSATGLTSNLLYSTVAIFLILSSVGSSPGSLVSPGAIVGMGLLIIMLFLAQGNYRVLKESDIRAKIAGQT
ncbi:hypothetical protein [Halopiger xanaduensis]|uniref:Uncharacterized protein n=1 Tax=Halopiger xanaduensis (strain DSM 18323 / JCM 14033 / SH-6) TaxID=797210 RepID=F8DEU2_HALXS|nr:hypothetical protein [Halopiger xanaduensis]AEH39532.1 hypothetical protein Halxa_0293 [Halopiger xanaduensis SH-6]